MPATLQSSNNALNPSIICNKFSCLFAGDSLNSTGYVQWAINEPDSGNTANCGAVKRSGQMYDSYCRNLFPFFCEQNL